MARGSEKTPKKRRGTTGGELFIVDNSDETWKVQRYLHDWCQLSERMGKDRRGRVLPKDDVKHYCKIVEAIEETIRLMGEIDEVIEAHGGWPDAFITDPKKLEELKGQTRHGQ